MLTDLAAAGDSIAQGLDLAKVLAVLYYPFVPVAANKVWEFLGEKDGLVETGFAGCFDEIKAGTKLTKIGLLFAKLDDKKIAELKQRFG